MTSTTQLRAEAPVPFWDSRLNKYNEQNGKVRGVLCGLLPAKPQPGAHYWRLISAVFLDEDEAQGKHEIAVYAIDDAGKPTYALSEQGWPDYPNADEIVTREAPIGWPLYGGYDPLYENGPYWAKIKGESDVFYGAGLPYRHHVSYRLTFQQCTAEVEQPEPSPPPPPDADTAAILADIQQHLSELHGCWHEVLQEAQLTRAVVQDSLTMAQEARDRARAIMQHMGIADPPEWA